MANLNKELPYVVQCKGMAPYFENIAAFNVDSVAKWYADECRKVNRQFEYRVAQMVDGELR